MIAFYNQREDGLRILHLGDTEIEFYGKGSHEYILLTSFPPSLLDHPHFIELPYESLLKFITAYKESMADEDPIDSIVTTSIWYKENEGWGLSNGGIFIGQFISKEKLKG